MSGTGVPGGFDRVNGALKNEAEDYIVWDVLAPLGAGTSCLDEGGEGAERHSDHNTFSLSFEDS
uniref:Uncharacterized protein n=1 Tax=Timema monikensis TaxID=170555 RepID=A0A7R9E723_9NEOP|nr:unnamed protein product [Timema monikensis]